MARINSDEILKQLKNPERPSNNAESKHNGSIPKVKVHSPEVNDFVENIRKLPIREIDPKKCRLWKYHNRDQHWFNSDLCSDLIFSIEKYGQREPAYVRKLPQEQAEDYEIIYGARRWFSCSHLQKPLLVRVIDADDKDCMAMMHSENADSVDITEFERAYSFLQQYKSGVFKNQTDMAKTFGIAQSTISKLILAAEIYDEEWIRELIPSRLDISVTKAVKLARILNKADSLSPFKEEAIRIKNSTVPIKPKAVLSLLMAVADKPNDSLKELSKFNVTDKGGKALLSAKQLKNGNIVLTLNSKVSKQGRTNISQAIASLIEECIED